MTVRYRFGFALGDDIKIVYAQSEAEARAKFTKTYGYDAGDVISKDRW